MPFEGFVDADYDVFLIPGFAERMAEMRSRVRPKLVALGDELVSSLRPSFGPELFAHVASHLRRRVNPPEHTWVAFGPSRAGYKAFPHLSVGLDRSGPYLEFIVMMESDQKSTLSAGLRRNDAALAAYLRTLPDFSVHLDHHAAEPGVAAAAMSREELSRIAGEVERLKKNEFMIARAFPRGDERVRGRALLDTAAVDLARLEPFYRCALDPAFVFNG